MCSKPTNCKFWWIHDGNKRKARIVGADENPNACRLCSLREAKDLCLALYALVIYSESMSSVVFIYILFIN
jgi:hypothetical protein